MHIILQKAKKWGRGTTIRSCLVLNRTNGPPELCLVVVAVRDVAATQDPLKLEIPEGMWEILHIKHAMISLALL